MEPLLLDGPSMPWAETIDYFKDMNDFIRPIELDYVDDPTGLFLPSLTPVMVRWSQETFSFHLLNIYVSSPFNYSLRLRMKSRKGSGSFLYLLPFSPGPTI